MAAGSMELDDVGNGFVDARDFLEAASSTTTWGGTARAVRPSAARA
jgi:hypothetical protein